MGAKLTINESFKKKIDSIKALNAMEKAIKQTMYDLMKESVKEAPGPGRSRTPNPTGNLRRSHSVDVRVSNPLVEGLLKNSAKYWTFVAFGTSKMDADNFVERAFMKIAPNKKVSERFKKNFKGG